MRKGMEAHSPKPVNSLLFSRLSTANSLWAILWQALCDGACQIMFHLEVLQRVRHAAHKLLLIAGLVLAGTYACSAASVTLAWDPSPDTNVVGYNVYVGTASRTYTQVHDAGNATMLTIADLVEGTTYYFAATAYDSWGLESDYSPETTYTIPLPVINYPPTLNGFAAITLPENAAEQTVALSGISSGSAAEAQTLTVTATSSNPALIPTPVISYVSPATTGTLRFTPVAFMSGSSTINVTVNDGGPTNSIVTKSFVVTVTSVNQAPTLTVPSDITVDEDSAPFTANLAGISSGAPNESQTLTVTASSSNTSLIPAPTVTYTSPAATGTLTLRPVATKFGSATITVTVRDSGTSNNIVTKTFNVTVAAVNDPPTINTPANIAINVNAGVQTVSLTGISTGATNETQTLTVTATSSNPSLIPSPTVTYTSPAATGTLRFTPNANATGTATITLTVADSGGATKTAQFTVLVNNLPSISDIPHRSVALGSNMPPVAFTISDPDTAASSLTVTATSSNTQLVPNSAIILAGSGANRTIAINPLANRTGVATITVTVSDGTGSASDTFQFSVQLRPTPPGNFRVVVEGEGQVLGSPTALVVGQTYTISAVAGPSQEFAGWSGTFESSNPKLTFVATTDVQLKARFVPSPYLGTKGTYKGLFYESDELKQHSTGFFSLQSSSRGKYTGYLQIGLRKYPFSGKFNLDCMATNLIARRGTNPITLQLALDTNGLDKVSGWVSEGSWVADLSGDRSTFHIRTNPAPWKGQYTMVLAGQDGDPQLPAGDSYGTVKVSASGLSIWAGKLADGTAISRSTPISKNGVIPLYVPLYRGQGSLLSWTAIEDRPTDDFTGESHWIKPSNLASSNFPSGFSFRSAIAGSRWVRTNGVPMIELANSAVQFNVDGREFGNPIEVALNGRITNLGTNRMSMTIVPGTGQFKGSIIDPGTGKSIAFGGSLLQKQNAGFGYFKSGYAFGRVTVH